MTDFIETFCCDCQHSNNKIELLLPPKKEGVFNYIVVCGGKRCDKATKQFNAEASVKHIGDLIKDPCPFEEVGVDYYEVIRRC